MTEEKKPLGRRFPAIPMRPSDDLLHSGVAILSGGHDTLGLPLIVFPVKSHTHLLTTKVNDICQLIKYFISITRPGQRLNGFAFLIDLKVANVQLFNIVVETLETLQRENQGCVAVFYCLQPKGKEASKFLKKLLGLKEKKRRLRLPFKKSTYKLESQRGRNSCIFKTVLMADLTELYRYIEGRQLTTEFGGTLLFNLESWILFRQGLESLYKDIDRVCESVPSTQDKIEMLKEYDLPETNEELEQLLGWIRNRYHDVMKELNIEETIDECKGTISKCKTPDSYAIYSDLQHNHMLTDAIILLEKHHVRLVTSRNQLQLSWQEAEKRLKKASNVRSYKEKTEKILKWINDVGMPQFKKTIEVADSLSQAETLKNHFEAGFYTTGKERLSEADELIENMDKATLDTTTEIKESVEYSRNFLAQVSEFRQLLERRLRQYLDVYHFYLLTGKVTRWYRRTLNFLPVQYLSHYIDYDQDDIVPLCQEWNAEVNKYLYKHPAPRVEHLNKIRDGVPLVTNMRNRNQARLLVHRVGLLRNLLVEGKITVLHYEELIKLKEKVLRGFDDLDNDLSRSMPDLTRIARAESANRHHNMSATLSRLPPTYQNDRMDLEPPVSRAKSISTLYAPRRGSDAMDFEPSEMESRPRPRLGLSATMDRHQKAQELYADPDSNLRRFRSQPLVNQPQTYHTLDRQSSRDRDSIGRKGLVPKHSSKHTPGRRFVKARDQRTSRNHSQSYVGDDSDNTELSYPTNKRTFSFHRNPVDRNDYGIYGESDNCDDSVFSGQSSCSTLPPRDIRERYISLNFPSEPLSLPCSPPPHFFGGDQMSSSQSNNSRGNQSLPAAFRTKEDSYDSGIGYTEPGIHAGARINPLYSSLPNLLAKDLRLPQKMHKEDGLSMTQENLNKISRSHLLPAEKLELMSAMLDNDSVSQSPRQGRAVDPVKLPNAHVTNNLRLTPEEQNLVREILDKQKDEKRKQEQYFKEEIGRRAGGNTDSLQRRPQIYFNRPEADAEDEESSESSGAESEDDSNAGASTDEDVKRLNEAIQARRQEQLRLARNRQKLHQIDEQSSSPTKEQGYRSPEQVIQDGTRRRSPRLVPHSPSLSHEDPLGYTLQRLQQASPRQNRENGIYGTDSDYSGSEANSSMKGSKPEEDFNRNRVMENGNTSNVKEWVQRYDRKGQASDSGYTGIASNTDLNDSIVDEMPDLKEIETLENTLKKHAIMERKAMIEQSRERMLRDMIDIGLSTPQDSPGEKRAGEPNAFFY